MRFYFAVIVVAVCILGSYFVESYRTLPINLQECYTNEGNFISALPLNLQVLLDIIRKLERQTTSSMSMRTLSTALIKRFKLDGIVYSSDLPFNENVLRFAARGSQRARNRIVEELVPGDPSNLPENVLTRDERCVLHFAMSNTIWDHYDEAEEELCKPGPSEKMEGNVPYRSIPSPSDKCPKEGGVILTPFGTVAIGSVIAAIAAALEPQIVKTKLLLRMPVEDEAGYGPQSRILYSELEDEVNFTLPKEQMNSHRSGWLESARITDTQIDNVWIATIGGELAEMVIYQGPIYEERMFLGATGFWNRTMRPQVYYVTHKFDNFDFTRAEIIGGVDGLIIAKNLANWMKNFENLRLSQILDMYYSEKGVVFDKEVTACHRGDQFPKVGPKSMVEEQTYAASQVLAYLNSVAAMEDSAFQRLVVRAVDKFSHYTNDHLFTEIQCRNDRRRRQVQVEMMLAFDGSWTRDYISNFLAVLVEDLDISRFGSKMGLLHGETGKWLLNVTSSPSDVHQAINNLRNITWPKKIKLNAIFESVLTYVDQLWEETRNNNTIGSLGQAVVILIPEIEFLEEERRIALDALNKLKSKHPELHFLYYTQESMADILRPFLLSDEDRIIKSLDVDDISRHLSAVPMTLRPAGCNKDIPGVRLQLEDYVSTSESITYRLHPKWRVKTKKVTLSLHGVGYGTLNVCWWNQWTHNGVRLRTYCKDLSLFGDISLTDYNLCDKSNKCPNTYFQISNVSTVTKCTEIDCRVPDQVRYIVRMETFQCLSSSNIISINLFLLISLLTSFVVF